MEIYELSTARVCVRVLRQEAALNIQTQRKARGVISIWSKINLIKAWGMKPLQLTFLLRIHTVLLLKYAYDKRCCQLNCFNRLRHQK